MLKISATSKFAVADKANDTGLSHTSNATFAVMDAVVPKYVADAVQAMPKQFADSEQAMPGVAACASYNNRTS